MSDPEQARASTNGSEVVLEVQRGRIQKNGDTADDKYEKEDEDTPRNLGDLVED
jgi:hypothetical protein